MADDKLTGKKILIVEDDPSSRLYITTIILKTGAVVLNAEDGLQAIQIVNDNPDLALVLMDIQLPVMDGFQAAKKIREAGHKVPIVAQTAYGLLSDIEEIKSGGFDDYLIKPIYSSQLIEMIQRVIA